MIFISHDLTVVSHLCDRVAVMYLGRIVEEGSADQVLGDPRHPYTQALLEAAPTMGQPRERAAVRGEPPSPLDVPTGCRFHPRCPIAQHDLCDVQEPTLADRPGHRAACHYAWRKPPADETNRVQST
jgi:oligopeptide/dipeptide ABC transporter ATP-binding protein